MTTGRHSGSGPAFGIRVERTEQLVEVWVWGDLDIATSPRVLEPLREQFDTGPVARLIIDLAGVTFIDSTGLRVLINALQMAEIHDCRLFLRSVSDPVARLLDVVKLEGRFPTVDD